MTAELLMMMGGMGAFALTVYWVRNRELGEKHAIVWLALAVLLLVCGVFPQIIMNLADACRLSYTSLVLFIALAAIYVCSFAFSVSLSRRHRQAVRLTQELAILEQRIRKLERELRP